MSQQWLLAAMLVASAMTVSACDECDIHEWAAQQAGEGSLWCGFVPLGALWGPAFDCAIDAFERGEGFRAVFVEQGTDSAVRFAIAGNAQGEVRTAIWDSDPSGGGGSSPVITAFECVEPVVAKVNPGSWWVVSDKMGLDQQVFDCSLESPRGRRVCE